jgi:hypothetical protein
MRVLVLADDLIWSTRLVNDLRACGADPLRIRTLAALDSASGADALIVDLTARVYDGIAAIELAAAAGLRVMAVGQHDDAELRRRALAAGAELVRPYRRLFEDGPATLARWLAMAVEAPAG